MNIPGIPILRLEKQPCWYKLPIGAVETSVFLSQIFFQPSSAEKASLTNNARTPGGKNRFKERRRHQRFTAREDSFALLKPHSKILGQIIDVSRGGLSFRYLPNRDNESLGKNEYELHILLADHSFYFDPFPCRIVSETDLRDNEFGFSLLAMKRRSVEFLDLSDEQVVQLEYFTRNHTVRTEKSPVGFREKSM